MNEQNSSPPKSFFETFSEEAIFNELSNSKTLLEVAQKLGFNNKEGLQRVDYEYFLSLKTRGNWKNLLRNSPSGLESQRYFAVSQLSKIELETAMNSKGIETVAHLATHFLLSQKHGRAPIKKRLVDLGIDIKDSLYKGVYGVSKQPMTWPTPYYQKSVGQKPECCPVCGFKALMSEQIQLHHAGAADYGPKENRTKDYYTESSIEPMCANCHSLIHRNGKELLSTCGRWKVNPPNNLKYNPPFAIFKKDSPETYRLQKVYFMRTYITKNSYKCNNCGVFKWGPTQKTLALELHHRDCDQQNAQLANLELLCPNCNILVNAQCLECSS